MRMTPQHFHTILHLVPFCQLCTPRNSLHAIRTFICTKWTRYSALLTPVFHRSISAMFSSSKISQRNKLQLKLQHTINTQALLMHSKVSAYTIIRRADIEGSKSNMNAWLPQASYPCGNFSDTSSLKLLETKESIGHAFTVCIHTENQNQAGQLGHICHAQYSNSIVHCSHPQHNSLKMQINMHYTPSTTHHTAFHNPLHTTNAKHICLSGAKIAQGVGMV